MFKLFILSLLLIIFPLSSSLAKSDKSILKDKCKTYEKNHKNTKCDVGKEKCKDKRGDWKWKQEGKQKGKYRMCVRADCDRKCKKKLKDKCDTFKKKNKNHKCKIKSANKGCKPPYKQKSKIGDSVMCVKEKCDRKCRDQKGKKAAKKICDEIKKASGRPCKVVKANWRRKKKECGDGWAPQEKIRKVKGYNTKNYLACIKKNFNARKANSLSGSSSSYDSTIESAINIGIASNLNLQEIQDDLNEEICKAINKYRILSPQAEIKKCTSNAEPGFRIGSSTPKVGIKNAARSGRTISFDYKIKWKTSGLKLNYKKVTECKYRKKKDKGRKKDWKCPDVTFRLKDFDLSLLGSGTATINPSGSYSYDLKNDEKSFKHSARFTACMKIIGIKYCPAEVERTVSKTLKDSILKALNDI